MTIPQANQIPKGDKLVEDEQPLHRQIEDCKPITELSIRVDRLLGADTTLGEILLIVGVDIATTKRTWANIEL